MRLTEQQQQTILQVVAQVAGTRAQVSLFGSRVDDDKKGGDIDLLVTLPEEVEHPAQLAAKLSAQLMRHFSGRHVDILLSAPNLDRLPIHTLALQQGIRL